MGSNQTETEIITKAIGGDQQAFRWLVEKHQRFVYTVCFRMIGNRADTEDITQETFVRLWKHLSRYRPGIRLTTWLYSIATNLCLDHLRSSKHKSSMKTIETDETVPAPQNTQQNPPNSSVPAAPPAEPIRTPVGPVAKPSAGPVAPVAPVAPAGTKPTTAATTAPK